METDFLAGLMLGAIATNIIYILLILSWTLREK